ncbi:hypothetical protein V2J09_016501 [Rumex salicifolius]
MGRDLLTLHLSEVLKRPIRSIPLRQNALHCCSFLSSGSNITNSSIKTVTTVLTRSYYFLQGSPFIIKLVTAVGVVVFTLWGVGPLLRSSRNFFQHKNDNSWRKSTTHYVLTSYLQPALLWTGAMLVCRALDPVVMPTEASHLIKQRLLTFVRSLSTVLSFAYCLSCAIQQAQKFFMQTSDPSNARNMGFHFAGKAVYTAVWVAAVSLFMELLGFSTQKLLTAGGLGTVLLTLAGREIFTNFLSSAMIHATRPFMLNEWIQTRIEGYEVSGFVEHVGWWSPTIIRGEDREAVHIPNHKFTVNVVRNLSQKTHWRIKTHLAVSHLDVSKINNIVADMRKVLAKNPQVEQQKLHRRVFLDNVDTENQALLYPSSCLTFNYADLYTLNRSAEFGYSFVYILVSCFVKTSHHEEYLCVKEAILLDLLRVISHHGARLATPIRSIQKLASEADMENIPFSRGGTAASSRPFLLIEPSYKINGEEKVKPRSAQSGGDQDSKKDAKLRPPTSESKSKETITSGSKRETINADAQNESKGLPLSTSTVKSSALTSVSGKDSKVADAVAKAPTTSSDKKPGHGEEFKGKPISSSTFKSSPLTSVSDKDGQVANALVKSPSTSSDKKPGQGEEFKGKPLSSSTVISSASTSVFSKDSKVANAVVNGEVLQSSKANVSNSLEYSPEKLNGSPSGNIQSKQDEKPAMEENIFLEVALEGSKRTLPIDDDNADSSPPAAKEAAANQSSSGNGRGNSASSDDEKDK